MCLGIPMRIVESLGLAAIAERSDGTREQIDLSLVGPQPAGCHVLVFLGAARETLDPARAAEIERAIDALGRVMTGGEIGDAFADLEGREPPLPPHLAAALAEGRKTG